MIVHLVVLYVLTVAGIVVGVLTFKRPGDPPTAPRAVIRALWPFLALGMIEACYMDWHGNLLAEWAFPMLATWAVTVASREPALAMWVQKVLLVTAMVLLCHGHAVMNQGYTTRPDYHSLRPSSRPTEHAEWGWMTPLNGMRYRVPDVPQGEGR